MNDVIRFSYQDYTIRTQIENGEIFFVAKDVCDVLEISKYRDALGRLGADEKGCPVRVGTPGGPQELSTVNESGLYTLILRSDKPIAKKFRRWITHEVLPQIRKTGRYEHDSEPNDAAAAIALFESNLNAFKKIYSEVHQNSKSIKKIEEAQARTATAENYFTIMGYANLNGHRSIDRTRGISLGKKATRLCHEKGYLTYSTPDPRFGKVKTYPKEILEIVFMT